MFPTGPRDHEVYGNCTPDSVPRTAGKNSNFKPSLEKQTKTHANPSVKRGGLPFDFVYISGQGHCIIDLRSCPCQFVQIVSLNKTFEKRSSFRLTRMIWFDLNMKLMPRTHEQGLTKKYPLT